MHSRKTAGSSLATCLNRILGPDDIQIGAWVDSINAGGKYNKNALKVLAHYPIKIILSSLKYSFYQKKLSLSAEAINSAIKLYYSNKSKGLLSTHCRAKDAKLYFSDVWDKYFKFAFIRNPYSQVVSDYYWRLHLCGNPDVTFREFVYRLFDLSRLDKENMRPPIISNWEIYTINNSIELDFIGCFENLEHDLMELENFIGVKLSENIVRSKGAIRAKDKTIEQHYDQELIDMVTKIYSNEINHFGYSPFEGKPKDL